MQARGITVIAADAPGWPIPPTMGGRKPDVIGHYPVVGVPVAGEAKRGPEVWSCFPQFYEEAQSLSGLCPRGACSLLILAVGDGWEGDAAVVCDVLTGPGTWVTVWPAA
jgi:hypothetical protein